MTIYAALLRGINVGGKNIVKMADLRKMFESLGLLKVQTYIQSGNVVFHSNADEQTLRHRIEDGMASVFGLKVRVVIRTINELENAIKNIPFSTETRCSVYSPEFDTFYFVFLASPPARSEIEQILSVKEEDEFVLAGRNAYLLLKKGIRKSKLAARIQRLDEPSTIRNFKTINALIDLAKDIG